MADDGIGQRSCLMLGFGISDVEPSGSATRELSSLLITLEL